LAEAVSAHLSENDGIEGSQMKMIDIRKREKVVVSYYSIQYSRLNARIMTYLTSICSFTAH